MDRACVLCLAYALVCGLGLAVWYSAAHGHTPSKFETAEVTINGMQREIPLPPRGPVTKSFAKHWFVPVEYRLLYDSSNTTHGRDFLSFTSRWSSPESVAAYRQAWIARAKHFRQLLSEQGVNNADPEMALQDAPYRQAAMNRTVEGNEVKNPPNPLDVSVGDANAFRRRFDYCLKNPNSCGDHKTPPIVDVSLVIPLLAPRYNETLRSLESIRQLTVFPKEIVFTLSNVDEKTEQQTSVFLSLLKDVYGDFLPDGVTMRAFVAKDKYFVGEQRWFGFNQTTAPVVMLFDSDDYLHPQAVQVVYELFQLRTDLDEATFKFSRHNVAHDRNWGKSYRGTERLLSTKLDSVGIASLADYSVDEYEKERKKIPKFNKLWWLGNGDADPIITRFQFLRCSYRKGCAHGWHVVRRHVIELIGYPTGEIHPEDTLFNWRVRRAGLNYRCFLEFPLAMWAYWGRVRTNNRPTELWQKIDKL